MDCSRCPKHPGAAPDDFWGTEPDDEMPVPTADAIQLPWPAGEVAREPGHHRNPSLDDEDPLQQIEDIPLSSNWRTTATVSTFQPMHSRTGSHDLPDPLQEDDQDDPAMAELTDNLAQLGTQEREIYVDTKFSKNKARIVFLNPEGKELKTEAHLWTESTVCQQDGQVVPCWSYKAASGRRYYTFVLGSGEQPQRGESSVDKKGKGKGKGRK